jgi:MtrB/PioB family decaheme-associated outer membrane protein
MRMPNLIPGVVTLAVLALLAAPNGARAQPSTMDATLSVGAGATSGNDADRALFGQYNGLRRRSGVGLLGAEYSRRNDETGSAVEFSAIDLLGDNRELRFGWKKLDDWKFGAQFSQGVREDPLAPSDGAQLKVKRTRLGAAYSKVLDARWQLDLNLSSENKEGARLFGIGFSCPSSLAPTCGGSNGTQTGWAILMLPEPIDANHSQLGLRASYAGERLRASVGYHGSFYRNHIGSLQPQAPSSLNNALGSLLPLGPGLQAILNQPVALAPDNQAHEIDVSGVYSFSASTHLNFRVAHAQMLQHQDFAAAGLAGASARVDTTLAQLGLAARPWPRLSLNAKLRYENRSDETPLALYNVEGGNSYTNRRLPHTKWRGQVQAHYQFTSDLRGTLGADHEAIDRGVFTATSAVAGLTALRQKTDETGLRAELRRRIGDSVSGAIVLTSHRRDGSNWLRDNSGRGVSEVPDANDPATGFASGIFMPTLADRRRDTVKLVADWQPNDELALQLGAQNGRDRFSTPSIYGLRKSGHDEIHLDASYAASERWRFTGNLSIGTQTLLQARPEGVTLDYDNRSISGSVGVVGKPMAKLEVGANLSAIDDRSLYDQVPDALTNAADAVLLAATGGLPRIVFRQAIMTLYGRYDIDKRTALRLDLVHQRSTWSDWAWAYNGVPFRYSDGTTLTQQPRQHVTFVGLRYVYRWP